MLTSKAIQGYAPFFDYEAHILVRSMYFETEMGKKAIDPAHFVARYALKYVHGGRMNVGFSLAYSNMLTISFGSRTNSMLDPLVERATYLAAEYMDLTGRTPSPLLDDQNSNQGLFQVHCQTSLTSLNHFSGFPRLRDHVPVGFKMGSWKSTAP